MFYGKFFGFIDGWDVAVGLLFGWDLSEKSLWGFAGSAVAGNVRDVGSNCEIPPDAGKLIQ